MDDLEKARLIEAIDGMSASDIVEHLEDEWLPDHDKQLLTQRDQELAMFMFDHGFADIGKMLNETAGKPIFINDEEQ